MSDALRNLISYPGISSPVQASYTLQHGANPGVVAIDINPVDLAQIALSGPMVFGDGNTSVVIPSCRLERADITRDPSGHRIRLYLFDRRWKWPYYTISGHYNEPVARVYDVPKVARPRAGGQTPQQSGNATQRDDSDKLPSVQEERKRSARGLARLLLTQMGEKRFNIAALPDNDFPEVNWDVANCARELETLCEKYGCRISYNPFTDSAVVVRLGHGSDLPAPGPGEDGGLTVGIDPPEPPSKIVVYSAPRVYQVRFELEAVGLDFDGRVKLLDDLTYKPTAGWNKKPPPIHFRNDDTITFATPLPDGYTYLDANNVANQSVYRWYRIRYTLPRPKDANPDDVNDSSFWFRPDSKDPKDKVPRNRIELLEYLPEASEDAFKQRILMPARVYGRTTRGDANYRQTTLEQEVKVPFEIDNDRQLIKFVRPMVSLHTVGEANPAILILECGVRIRDKDSAAYRRWTYTLEPPKRPTKRKNPVATSEYALVQDDVKHWTRIDYVNPTNNDITTTSINTVTSNEPACKEQARYYAEGALALFQTKATGQQTYNGIKQLACDGVVQSVTWMAGPVPQTVASANSEAPSVRMPYLVARRQAETTLERLKAEKREIRSLRARIRIAKDYGVL